VHHNQRSIHLVPFHSICSFMCASAIAAASSPCPVLSYSIQLSHPIYCSIKSFNTGCTYMNHYDTTNCISLCPFVRFNHLFDHPSIHNQLQSHHAQFLLPSLVHAWPWLATNVSTTRNNVHSGSTSRYFITPDQCSMVICW
jgi:hypothetical protein